MERYTQLNNNNLFLVSLDGDAPPLTGDQALSLEVTARVSSDDPGGDSRSDPTKRAQARAILTRHTAATRNWWTRSCLISEAQA